MTYTNAELEEIGARVIVSATDDMQSYERVPQGGGPDFLLSGGRGKIGLEITLLQRTEDHSGRPRRAMEGMREQLLDGLRNLWRVRGGLPIEVRISFARHQSPDKASLPLDVERLCSFVTTRVPRMNSHGEFGSDRDDRDALPNCVARVSIARFDARTEANWFGTDVSLVPDLSPSDVQARIDAKELKFTTYQVAASEVWLGIVLDGFRPSGHFTVTNEVRATGYPTRFARVFLVEAFRGAAIQLLRGSVGDAA